MIAIRGRVQGVGFRPFVYRLATRLGLAGSVGNRPGSVIIDVEGTIAALDAFIDEMTRAAPPLARIEALEVTQRPPRGEGSFRIEPSEDAHAAGGLPVAADVATCDDCLRELADPEDRRYQYPFIACASCGPRLTILERTPFDRERTTMARFTMCPACRAEYEAPHDRRFHAQITSCPACGPRLSLRDAEGRLTAADAIPAAAAALRAGRLVAVKGLGGYHVACDAGHHEAVVELRRRKHRDAQPLALMVRDLDAAAALAELTPEERALLRSPRRPIVLARAREGAGISPAVAPGVRALGLMLPYTPLHVMLLDATGGPLVMTSGNRSSEPIARDDAEALARLGGVADLFLGHDRPIRTRCDDSVARVVAGVPVVTRRSRGFAPEPLPLPVPCVEPTLALGGQLKVTLALGCGGEAFLSPHVGDLDDVATYHAYRDAIAQIEALLGVSPTVLVRDAHPDYVSTRLAQERARDEGIEVVVVQHHHAHMASCMAEHGLDEPVLGVTFDGTGFGLDGTVWGGEFLAGDLRSFRRAAHLRPVPMPGSDRAVREPWRMALSHLHDAGAADAAERLVGGVPGSSLRLVRQMLDRRVQAPLTSSMGRLFDAIAALCGVRHATTYEGQAAVELEALADGLAPRGYPFRLEDGDPVVIDTRPLIRAIVHDVAGGVDPAAVARRFHTTVVDLIEAACVRLRERTGVDAVVLSGGVFGNVLVSESAVLRLTAARFRVYCNRFVPCNDGGLSLGQLAVAAARRQAEQQRKITMCLNAPGRVVEE
ncbi:carbamoyltransferase HypF [Sorangium cellulosum]|uniref:carbamoyltransferase HypF n=1 Tax=Sorangium cellulosum TaxID=56 RepID=UPI001F39A8C7|nr:carbamoyltransferase HypF [Sorangium cellulosum]